MDFKTRLANRLASMVIGVALSIIAVIFIALGLTFLPVIGILLAFPVMGLASFFLNSKMEVLEMKHTKEVVDREPEHWCPWPRIPGGLVAGKS